MSKGDTETSKSDLTVTTELKPFSAMQTGLTWRSALAILYIIVVFQPPLLYLYLMTGQTTVMTAVQWATLILFVELARLSGRPLSRHEAIIMFLGSWQATRFTWFLNGAMAGINPTAPGWLYQLYLRYSPIIKSMGIAEKIPGFYSPPSPDVWTYRTFFHPDWVQIILIAAYFTITQEACNFLLGLIGYQLTYRVERLPFPTQRPNAEAVLVLTERERSRLEVLSIMAVLSFIYGLILYALPMIFRAYYRAPVFHLIPIPWIDVSWLLQKAVPGISFGLATDLVSYVTGFIVPFPAVVGMFIGSAAISLVGNPLLLSTFKDTRIHAWNMFAKEYEYGMSITDIWQRSTLYIWSGPIIGITLAAGLMPIILRPEVIRNTFSTLRRAREEGGGFNLWIILAPYLAMTLVLSALDYYLAPDFPILFYVLLNTAWPFLYMLAVVRGEATAIGFSIPYVREMTILGSGYQGIAAWFAPIYVPVPWSAALAVCDMTDTKPLSYVKLMAILYPVAFVFGFVYVQSFWNMAPIPSAMFPGTQIYWPVQAIYQTIFIGGPEIMRPIWIAGGAAVLAVLYPILYRLGWAAATIGLAAGVASPIPNMASMLIGAVVGKIIQRFMGVENFNKYRAIIIAGVALGTGLAVGLGSAISIIITTMWIAPY